MVSIKILMSALVSILLVCMLKSPSSSILLSIVSWSAIHAVNSSMNIDIVTGNVFEYGGLYIAITTMLLPGRLTFHLAASKLFGLSISKLLIVKLDLEISASPPPLLCFSI